MKPITKEWIEKAEGDYKAGTVQWDTRDPVYDDVCFHAQQCAEKYLKAWLEEKGINFSKTHDLLELAKLCLPTLPELSNIMPDMRFTYRAAFQPDTFQNDAFQVGEPLGKIGIKVRYPGTPAEKRDAESCWRVALQTRNFIREKLGTEIK